MHIFRLKACLGTLPELVLNIFRNMYLYLVFVWRTSFGQRNLIYVLGVPIKKCTRPIKEHVFSFTFRFKDFV